MLLENERTEVVEICQRLVDDRLVVGTSGNVSVRAGDLVAVTPSGVDYRKLTPEFISVIKIDGTPVDSPLKPASETPLHLSIYAESDANAIVHNHATASTALSIVVDEVPTSHYYSALFGGQVRVAEYATFGTDQLARNVTLALKDRTGALMSNHGAVCIGDDLAKAYDKALYLEWLCDIQLRAMSTGAPVKTLPLDEIENVVRLVQGYGQSIPAEAKA